MELYHDATVYDQPMITVVEIMGRNAGWLTAAAALAQWKGQGPDLVYLPEKVFNPEQFFADVKRILTQKGKVIVAVSEGVKNAEGKYIPELYQELKKDAFGHAQLGGTAQALANELANHFDVKIRAIEFSLMQRSAAHLASKVDVMEAFNAGRKAVKAAVSGTTDKMIGFKRISSNPYKIKYVKIPLQKAANEEQKVPLTWIKEDNTGLTQEYIDYALPLIQGDFKASLEDGLPRFAKLKKIKVNKL
jgi:6-phosphofructokinase 1